MRQDSPATQPACCPTRLPCSVSVCRIRKGCVDETVAVGVIATGVAVPDARLVVEGRRCNGVQLAAYMVVRSEQIAQIVDQCQLQRVGTRVQVRRQIDLVGCPQNPGDLLPVDTDAEGVDALLAEDQPSGGVALLQRQLAPDSQLARKNR